jgi:large subunit ribosomal protein L4
MQIDIVNIEGKKVGSADLDDAVFGAKVKDYLLWELVKAQQAAKRAGTHATKTRAHVRGGGKKPYKQKGTGNARQGSSRAPNHVGGGKVFGPHPRDYEYTVPKKVKRAALASALSLRVKEKKLVVVDKLAFDAPKTKAMAGILKTLGTAKALVIDEKSNANLFKSVRNLAKAKVLAPEGLNVFDILNHSDLVIAAGALKQIEKRVTASSAPAASSKSAA